MKILFLCGSLEPGRDGVGDYTRRLAGECTRRGHHCTMIALHDPHVSGPAGLAAWEGRLIRLSAADPWSDRVRCARQHLQRVAPDWVSWQFVPQGLHPRGFLPAILLQNAPDLRGLRCHVMLHELWLGLEAGSGWRARAIGWLQRRGVLCLLEQLDPDCVHTSNAAGQHVLRREGFVAGVLGLFGNVPVAAGHPGRTAVLARWLPAAGPPGTGPLVAVTFGTLHRQWRPAPTVAWLLATARSLGRPPVLLVLGRAGAHAPAILDGFRRQGVLVVVTGELAETDVSHLLLAADLGIAPHPWALIGKSGAAAAMLDHGLPVLVPRDDWRLRGAVPAFPSVPDPLLARLAGLDAGRTGRWLAGRRAPVPALPVITSLFLKSLERAAHQSVPLRP